MKPVNRRIRVLVADDSATARARVCDYLEFERVFAVVGTASDLRKSYPQVRTLIITQFGGSTIKDECLRRGADGYLEKSQMAETLMKEVARLFPGTTAQ